MTGINLSYQPFNLELKHTFTVSSYSRTFTPVILVELSFENHIGYGEASMPQYLGETQESAIAFLRKINLKQFKNPLNIDLILDYVDSVSSGNNAAKASLDIALHDLVGKLTGKPLYEIWGLDPNKAPASSFTIGIEQPQEMAERAKEIKEFGFIKLKLGTNFDKEIVSSVKKVTSLPLQVDVNQGWKKREYALEMACWLAEQGVVLLEQPLPKENLEDIFWLSQRSPIPVIADEGIKRLVDIQREYSAYNGVNVKLMKSTGLRECRKILEFAREKKLITMIGCMTETSCAVAAASHLSPLCAYADLDGPFLIKNNPFEDLKLKNGRIEIPSKPGIGIALRKETESNRT